MKKVMAVDDDHDVLYTLHAISEVGKFHLTTLDNGYNALKRLEREPFDLVIVDYYMPEMNGMELVGRIRAVEPKLPILVLTVDESLEIAHKFMEAGATDFATKPIRVADLVSRINLHLNSSVNIHELDFIDDQDIPKGMSAVTLQLIIRHLEQAKEPENIDSISKDTGLAYQTVHRYLSYLDQEGVVEVDLVYGKVGRPIKRYFKSS